MKFEDVVLLLGYLASVLVFATFFMRSRVRLREVGIASNVVFIVYAVVGHIIPVLVLHVCCRSTVGACGSSVRRVRDSMPR